MRNFSIYAVSIINLIIAVRYCVLLYQKRIKPALAMWVFFSLAVGMSLFTYLAEGNYSVWDNVLNTTDLVLAIAVTLAIALFGDRSSRFTPFDWGCLVAVVGIVIFWLVTRNHWATNLAVQAILVIAYLPVVKRLFEAQSNTEPFSVWILMLIAPALALLSSKGLMATIYSWRAICCVSLLLILMLRAEMKNGAYKQNR